MMLNELSKKLKNKIDVNALKSWITSMGPKDPAGYLVRPSDTPGMPAIPGVFRGQGVPVAEIHNISPGKIVFSYRWSSFKEGRAKNMEGLLALDQSSPEPAKEPIRQFDQEQRKKQPRLPGAGSIIRNLSRLSGASLKESKAKDSGAEISIRDANFTAKTGGVTERNVMALIRQGSGTVWSRSSAGD